jgi:hypothetical protein
MLRGLTEGKHLVESIGEALELILRMVSCHEVVDDIDQTLRLDVCSQTPHSVCGSVVFKLGLLVGMPEETVINQEAQDHAMACPLFARLLGQLAPAFRRLPVLHKNLYEPPQRVALNNIERPPTQVGGDQRAIALFLCIFARHNEPLGFVETDVQTRTADHRHALSTPTDADGVRRPGMGGNIVGHRLLALSDSHVLITADWREDLHALEQGRGLLDKGSRALEGIRGNTLHPEGGMVGLERRQQAQGKWLLGGILRMRCRFWGPLFGRDALLLESLGLLRPRPEFRGGLREDKAHG